MSEGQFKIGDLAVYPAQGVAEIVGIESRKIGPLTEIFYTLRITDTEKKIMIPVKKVDSVGLRPLVSKEEVEALMDLVRTPFQRQEPQETWNRRYRRYLEKIKSGQAVEVAEVYRDLCHIKRDKDLSFGERKMLEMARTLLVKEFSIALGDNEEAVEKALEGASLCGEPAPQA
jgi:CarD family transcriptional regulator